MYGGVHELTQPHLLLVNVSGSVACDWFVLLLFAGDHKLSIQLVQAHTAVCTVPACVCTGNCAPALL